MPLASARLFLAMRLRRVADRLAPLRAVNITVTGAWTSGTSGTSGSSFRTSYS